MSDKEVEPTVLEGQGISDDAAKQASNENTESVNTKSDNNPDTKSNADAKPVDNKADCKSVETEVKTIDLNNEKTKVKVTKLNPSANKSTSKSGGAPVNKSKAATTTAMQEITDKNDTMYTMSFNQDGGCLSVGTGSGFRICNVYPFVETIRRRLGDGEGGGELVFCACCVVFD